MASLKINFTGLYLPIATRIGQNVVYYRLQYKDYALSLCPPRLLDQVRSPLGKCIDRGLEVSGADQRDRACIHYPDIFNAVNLEGGVHDAVELSR